MKHIVQMITVVTVAAGISIATVFLFAWKDLQPTTEQTNTYRAFVIAPENASERWHLFQLTRRGVRRYWVTSYPAGDVPDVSRTFARHAGKPNSMPRWAIAKAIGQFHGQDGSNEIVIDTRGWPMPCMYAMADMKKNVIRGGWIIDPGPQKGFEWSIYPFAVPLTPIWSGLAINTALYAACIGTLWFGARSTVRLNRRRRGRCPHCAYDLRGEAGKGCPECGWNRNPALGSSESPR